MSALAAPRTTPPSDVDWSLLSPAALETVAHITLRECAGFNYEEIAEQLREARPTFRRLIVQPGKEISKAWVSARARELKREIEESGAASG